MSRPTGAQGRGSGRGGPAANARRARSDPSSHASGTAARPGHRRFGRWVEVPGAAEEPKPVRGRHARAPAPGPPGRVEGGGRGGEPGRRGEEGEAPAMPGWCVPGTARWWRVQLAQTARPASEALQHSS